MSDKTPTFELRDVPGDRIRIVRVGVEYPPDATPDAALPGFGGAPAMLEAVTPTGTLRTVATRYGFDVQRPDCCSAAGSVWLIYQDEANRTWRVRVDRGEIEAADPSMQPISVDWSAVPVLARQDVREWPSA